MYIANNTDYGNLTDDYNDSLSIHNNSTLNENNIDIIIPSLSLTILCGLSCLRLMSLMVYTLIKPLFINKGNYLQLYIYLYAIICTIIIVFIKYTLINDN